MMRIRILLILVCALKSTIMIGQCDCSYVKKHLQKEDSIKLENIALVVKNDLHKNRISNYFYNGYKDSIKLNIYGSDVVRDPEFYIVSTLNRTEILKISKLLDSLNVNDDNKSDSFNHQLILRIAKLRLCYMVMDSLDNYFSFRDSSVGYNKRFRNNRIYINSFYDVETNNLRFQRMLYFSADGKTSSYSVDLESGNMSCYEHYGRYILRDNLIIVEVINYNCHQVNRWMEYYRVRQGRIIEQDKSGKLVHNNGKKRRNSIFFLE